VTTTIELRGQKTAEENNVINEERTMEETGGERDPWVKGTKQDSQFWR